METLQGTRALGHGGRNETAYLQSSKSSRTIKNAPASSRDPHMSVESASSAAEPWLEILLGCYFRTSYSEHSWLNGGKHKTKPRNKGIRMNP